MPSNTSKNSKTFPKVSIIIPTLNSAKVLPSCLDSIKKQDYPNYEIFVCDGGSTDLTINIAQKYKSKIIINVLKTAEAGKAVGLKYATGKYISFIDSDNILPTPQWLSEMIFPLELDKTIIGSEPWEFTYRPNAGFIERYSSLIGANDPYAYINGNYDRFSYLSNKWTNLKLNTINNDKYIKINIDNNQNIPTIGANGTIFRRSFINTFFKGDYLFDIDILALAPKPLYFAKTKNGIIHTYCESSLKKFIKKQKRRVTDYYSYKKYRLYQWENNNRIYSFTLYSLLIIPSLYDAIKGFFKKPDIAWFFHPIACYLTWWIYFIITLKYNLKFLKPLDRQGWKQ